MSDQISSITPELVAYTQGRLATIMGNLEADITSLKAQRYAHVVSIIEDLLNLNFDAADSIERITQTDGDYIYIWFGDQEITVHITSN